MTKILIPVDFSDVAFNAFKYAFEMKGDECSYHVIHVNPRIYPTNEDMVALSSNEWHNSLENEVKKNLQEALGDSPMPSKLEVEILTGAVSPMLISYVKEKSIDMVIMGTRDKYTMIDRWIGTVSFALVKNLEIPIYLIPKYARYKSFRKALVASDYHMEDSELIGVVKDWNKEHKAQLRFLHVSDGKTEEYDAIKSQLIKNLYEKDEPDFFFEVDVLHSKQITHSLLASAYNYGADLLISLPQNRSLIHSLVFKSLSKELIERSSIPLLFLH